MLKGERLFEPGAPTVLHVETPQDVQTSVEHLPCILLFVAQEAEGEGVMKGLGKALWVYPS